MTSPITRRNFTPNVRIENPDARRHWQDGINVALLIVAVWTLFFAFFPEFALADGLEGRIANFVTAVITLFASAYGFTVTRPNIPKF